MLWANNGDAISQQYAGTSALKGDFTRTGERKFAGIMKDGMKSANRFYLRFKESSRLLAYEVLQGVRVSEEDLNNKPGSGGVVSTSNLQSMLGLGSPNNSVNNSTASLFMLDEGQSTSAQAEREENIKQLLVDCRKQLVDANEDCYGTWALINYSE